MKMSKEEENMKKKKTPACHCLLILPRLLKINGQLIVTRPLDVVTRHRLKSSPCVRACVILYIVFIFAYEHERSRELYTRREKRVDNERKKEDEKRTR
jgi:hypothetical protein